MSKAIGRSILNLLLKICPLPQGFPFFVAVYYGKKTVIPIRTTTSATTLGQLIIS
jgi:hypothetical protein